VDAEQVLAARNVEAANTDRLLIEAQRAARILKETVVAGSVFSELMAEVCPRCELDIGSERRVSEIEQNLCMVCARKHGDAGKDADDTLKRAEAAVEQLSSLRQDAVAAATAAASQVQTTEQASARARQEARDAEPRR